jgi:DNA transformation protein
MEKLSTLPNIGQTLEEKLIQAGIHTPEDLYLTGSENTLLRIRVFDDSACLNMLLALEGAIQGVRWHHLDNARKDELRQFMKINHIPLTPLK